MNVADIVILAVVALSMLLGLVRGFLGEVLSLICWVAAFWAAWAFGAVAAGWYAGLMPDRVVATVAGYVTCFLAVLVAGALAGWLLRGLLARSHLRGGDHALGALFGLARGAVLVTFAVLVMGFTPVPRAAAWWRQSVLIPPIAGVAGEFAHDLPSGVTQYLESGGESLEAARRTLPPLPGDSLTVIRRAARGVTLPAAASSSRSPADKIPLPPPSSHRRPR